MSTTRSLVLPLVLAAACGDRKPTVLAATGAAAIPALPGEGDRAYVTDGPALVEVSPTASQVIVKDVYWCNVDARAQVVWFTTVAGLSTFDLVDRRIHDVIRRPLANVDADGITRGTLEVIVDWGNERLGGEDPLAFDVGVAIKMAPMPSLEMVMGCEGDRMVYCFDEAHRPVPNVVALQALANQVRLADAHYVASLETRGARRSLWLPPPVPPQPPAPPALDRSRCHEMPERCGELTAIPGSSLWLVQTENSRGDYYHETRVLWDPAGGAFVRIAGGKLVRSTRASDDADVDDYGGLRVSSSATMSIGGMVFDGATMRYAPKEDGRTCGFASGWRVPGPRG